MQSMRADKVGRRRPLVQLLVFVGPVLLVACAGPAPSQSDVAGSERALVSQVEQVREIAWVSEFLADQMVPDCMRAEGFEYWPMLAVDGTVPSLDDEPEELDLTQPIDAADARNIEYTAGLDSESREAYGRALLGGSGEWLTLEHSNGGRTSYPASGCLPEARLTLLQEDDYLLLQESLVELEGLTFEIDDRAYASGDYQDGSAELHDCVRSEGYEVAGLEMDVEGFLDPDLDPGIADQVRRCAVELDLDARFQQLQDQSAYDLLETPRVEAILRRWAERSDAIFGSLVAAETELLG